MQTAVEGTFVQKSSLPVLVGIQFLLTILTLGYVAYFRMFQSPVEYPVVIVQSPNPESYTEKYKGKVTIFDLADMSEWEHYNDPVATESAHTGISFLYPPNFNVVTDEKGAIHLNQNNKDFLVISGTTVDITQALVPPSAKQIQFTAQKTFYQYEETQTQSTSAPGTTNTTPVVYQGGINGYGLTIVDTKAFSPEVVYLMLMSMDYVE